MKYARITDGRVAEIVIIPEGAAIADMFHPDIVSTMVAVPEEDVTVDWLYAGSGFSPPPAPEPPEIKIPSVTARQLRLWLLSRGRALSEVDDAIEALPVGVREPARIEWEYSTSYERAHPLIESIGDALGFTDVEIDEGFPEAAAL